MTERQKWLTYESEKRKLTEQMIHNPDLNYETEIQKIIERLMI